MAGINAKQRKLVDTILSGTTNYAAYKQVYKPDGTRDNVYYSSIASTILSLPNVRAYRQEQEKLIAEKVVASAVWEKENSIKELQFVIDQNKEEVLKIQEATRAQIEDVLAEMETTRDKEKMAQLGRKLVKLQSKYVIGKQHNDGIVQSVSELNRMHGFNKENVELTYPKITFVGEDDLEE